jgi:PST family polysaccharide transporter
VFFKSIFTFCIFLFLKDNSNIWVVPFFLSLGAITSGIASLFVAHYKFGISLYLTSFNSVKEQLKSAYHLFMSEIYMAVIAYSGVLILGFFSNNSIVGIYATAEKVIRTAGSMLSPIISALFPHVSKMMHEEPRKGKLFLEKIKNWGILLIVATTIVVFFLADYIFLVIFGTENSESVLAFRIMILFPLFSFLDQLYGKLVLVTLGKSALFFKVLSVISIMGMLINIVFSYKLGYIGTAIASTVIQFTFALGMYLSAQKALKATTK